MAAVVIDITSILEHWAHHRVSVRSDADQRARRYGGACIRRRWSALSTIAARARWRQVDDSNLGLGSSTLDIPIESVPNPPLGAAQLSARPLPLLGGAGYKMWMRSNALVSSS